MTGGDTHITSRMAWVTGEMSKALSVVGTAAIDGFFGLILGLLLIPLVTGVIAPVWSHLDIINRRR